VPTEMREIAFRETEFFSAVRDYRLRRGEPLPMGSVLGIEFEEDQSDLTAKIKIGRDEGDEVTSIELPTESIAAALIFFCINHKIPLPAHAAKSVKKLGSNIVLVININMLNYNAKNFSAKIPTLPYMRGRSAAEPFSIN
jgi:hypothetical protein